MEYSISCHTSTPATSVRGRARGDRPPSATPRHMRAAAMGSQSSGTAYLRASRSRNKFQGHCHGIGLTNRSCLHRVQAAAATTAGPAHDACSQLWLAHTCARSASTHRSSVHSFSQWQQHTQAAQPLENQTWHPRPAPPTAPQEPASPLGARHLLNERRGKHDGVAGGGHGHPLEVRLGVQLHHLREGAVRIRLGRQEMGGLSTHLTYTSGSSFTTCGKWKGAMDCAAGVVGRGCS